MYSDNMDAPYFRNGRKMRVLLPLWQGAEDQDGPGSACRRGRPVPGLPQRQENTGSAAVVARGGGPGRPRKCLSQGTASSGASTTAGKYGFRCRCGKGRTNRDAARSGQYGTTALHRSFLPKGLRRPHPRNLPYGDERSQNIHQEHSSSHDSSDHKYGQRP